MLFVQESSFHGISHLRYSKSKARIAFWIFLTFLGICYTGFEISREIIRISSGRSEICSDIPEQE
uniref:Uncharacterized protein n=1 Tax=Romanomermis culicivorax TaxID=13658 RepID=A0A915IPY3_ROMCU